MKVTLDRYRDITLAPDDIVWERPTREYRKARRGIYDEMYFMAYVEKHGLDASLREYTRLHRGIANELIRQDVTDPTATLWSRRAVVKCGQAKKRRQQLRAMLRSRDGVEAATKVFDELDAEFPRAERGVPWTTG